MKSLLTLNFVISFLFIMFFTNCKKEMSSTNASQEDISTSMQKIVGKYANLTIVNASSTNLSGKGNVVELNSLKEFEEAVAHLSEMASSIKVVPNPNETFNSNSLSLSKEAEKKQTLSNTPLDAGGTGSYAWVGSQEVGSTTSGYYQVSYFASFTYTALASAPLVNLISSVTALKSQSPDAAFEAAHFPGYYLYTYSYSAVSSGSGISASSQIASLSFSGIVNINCTYHYLGFTSVVSATSGPLAYNTLVASSTFPLLIQ